MRLKLFIIMLILLLASPGFSQVIIDEAWESQNYDNFDSDCPGGDCNNWPYFSIQSTTKHGGTYALENELQSGQTSTGFLSGAFGDQADITLEWWILWESGFQFASIGNKMFILNAFEAWGAYDGTTNNYARYYIIMSTLTSNSNAYHLQINNKNFTGASDNWVAYPQNMNLPASVATPGTWQKLKVRAKLNTVGLSDGILQMWVDDVLKTEYTNVNIRGTYTANLWNWLTISTLANVSSPATQFEYWDDILLTVTDSGPAPDTTDVHLQVTAQDVGGGVVDSCGYCQDGVGGCDANTALASMTGTLTKEGATDVWSDNVFLECGLSYTYHVRCEDDASPANESTTETVNFSITSFDATIPALDSVLIQASGTQVNLTFSEVVTTGVGGANNFTLAASGGPTTLTLASSVPSQVLSYSSSRKIRKNEIAAIHYSQPGNGIESNDDNTEMESCTYCVTVGNGSTISPPTSAVIGGFGQFGGF